MSAWLTQAGLAGTAETEILSRFCERCVAAGLPLARAQLSSTRFIPSTRAACFNGVLVQRGFSARLWPHEPGSAGRVRLGSRRDFVAVERWQRSPFYRMLQTGESLLRRRLSAAVSASSRCSGMAGSGDDRLCRDHHSLCRRRRHRRMDGVYSSWATRAPEGFKTAISRRSSVSCRSRARHQSVSLARMTATLDGDLSRPRRRPARARRTDRARHCRLDAAVWFSDLRGLRASPTLRRNRSSRCSTTTPMRSSRRSRSMAVTSSS